MLSLAPAPAALLALPPIHPSGSALLLATLAFVGLCFVRSLRGT